MTYKRKEVIGPHTLYLGDCMEIMPTIGRFDAVVTDPPYGIGEAAGKNKSRGKLATAQDYGSETWDSKTADEAVAHAVSISRSAIVFGGNYYDLPPSQCWLIWDKVNSGDFADCEMAWTNLPKAARLISWQWNGFIRRGEMSRKNGCWSVRSHPTEKPVGVMKWCIEHLPPPNTTILDPFMGSGTTGVACQKLGRVFTGVEISEKYFDIACKRIEEAMRQPDLFIEEPKKSEQLSIDLEANQCSS